jgi:hypothetical protein
MTVKKIRCTSNTAFPNVASSQWFEGTVTWINILPHWSSMILFIIIELWFSKENKQSHSTLGVQPRLITSWLVPIVPRQARIIPHHRIRYIKTESHTDKGESVTFWTLRVLYKNKNTGGSAQKIQFQIIMDYFMWIKWRRYKARRKRDWLSAPYICLLSVLFPSASSLSITILAFCIIYIIRSF